MQEAKLRSRLYSTVAYKPRQVLVTSRHSAVSRYTYHYPYVESMFEDAVLQPYIHDCLVTVHEGRHTYRFSVFFK